MSKTYKIATEPEIVSTQAVNATNVSIGGAALDPTPYVNLSIEQWKIGDIIVGGVLNLTVNGTMYEALGGGFAGIAGQARAKIDGIGSVGDCVPVVIDCGGTQLINGYGMISSVQVDEGPDPTWTQIATYSISVEIHENHGQKAVKTNAQASSWVSDGEMINDISESVTMSVQEDSMAVDTLLDLNMGRSQVKYDFDISVTGASVGCKSMISRKTGIEAAEEVVKRRVAALEAGNISSSLGSPATVTNDLQHYHGGQKYIQIRDMTADPVAGTLSVSGSLIVRPNNINHPDAFVEVSVESSKDVSRFGDSVVITGTLEGFDSASYSNFIQDFTFHPANKNKISAAEGAWGDIESRLPQIAQAYLGTGIDPEKASCIEGSLLGICQYQLPEGDFVCELREINRNITRNFGQGTITFTSEWSNAKNCGIQGAAKTTTDVTHTYPTELFAEFIIPFRGEPLLQDLGTTSKEVVSATVTITIDDAGCNEVILSNLRGCARGKAVELAFAEGAGSTWYLTQDSVSYSNTGNLTWNIEYTKNYDCI